MNAPKKIICSVPITTGCFPEPRINADTIAVNKKINGENASINFMIAEMMVLDVVKKLCQENLILKLLKVLLILVKERMK